jgi:hypothetical protein
MKGVHMINIDYDKDIIYEIDIDFHNKTNLPIVYSKQYDADTRYIVATVYKDGQEYTIPTGAVPMFCTTKPSGFGVANTSNCTIDNNKILYKMSYQTTSEHGDFLAEFRLSIPDGVKFKELSSPRFKMFVEPSALSNDTIMSAEEFNVLSGLIEESREVLENLRQLEIELNINEEQRKLNELERITNDVQREINESQRETSETDRKISESQRKLNEEQRLLDESQRKIDESERQDSEAQREINETQRKLNEEQRQINELDRIASEEDRKEYYNNFRVWEDYDNEKPYIYGNKVHHRGNSYICEIDCQGIAPDQSTTNWQIIAKEGEQGIQGIQGNDGNDGVVTEINGNYVFQITDGNLYIVYPDIDAAAPPFSIDEDGNLIVTIGE